MTDAMPSPFTGLIFEILVGSEKTRFVAHASVLEKSDKLKALTCGKWKDSSQRVIVLEDWEPETVGRFLEWLYTGDYETPFPVEASPSEAENLESHVSEKSMPSNEDTEDVLELCSPVKLENVSRTQRVLKPLQDINYNRADPKPTPSHAEAFTRWEASFTLWTPTPKKPLSGGLNFEGTLLAHAKLYSLADYMLLPVLQAQVFQRLKSVLLFIHTSYLRSQGFNLPADHQPVILNIITLIRYVYANTVRLVSEEEPLRELISTFVAFNYDKFKDDEGVVRKFMGQGGDFQEDLHDKMQMKVLDMDTELRLMKMELKGVKTKRAKGKGKVSEPQQPEWGVSWDAEPAF